MPTTTYKGWSVPTTGTETDTWGDELNQNTFAIGDRNLGGIVTKSLSSSNVTLTAEESQYLILRLTGTLTADVLVTTACQGLTVVENLTSGDFAVTFGNGVGTPVTVTQSSRAVIITDATNGPRDATNQTFTISDFGKTLVDDDDAATARETLGIAWEYIGSVTASGASNVDFSLPAGYSAFQVRSGQITFNTDNAILQMRFSQSSSFLSGATNYSWGYNYGYEGAVDHSFDTFDDEIETSFAIGNGSSEGAYIVAEFNRPLANGAYVSVLFQCGAIGYCFGSPSVFNGWGKLRLNTNAIDGIRFLAATGTISGQFDLYGLKAS